MKVGQTGREGEGVGGERTHALLPYENGGWGWGDKFSDNFPAITHHHSRKTRTTTYLWYKLKIRGYKKNQ